ncbi:MAG: NADP-dependent oxidoreductase [Candidatus Dormibacterales bacterium]
MRAFALDEFGKPGSIHEMPVPDPEQGQVRVALRAAALNPFDNVVLTGVLKDRMPHQFPLIPGGDLAGTVDVVGPGVNQWKAGDEVFGAVGKPALGRGSLAEFVTASAGTIARRPASVDPEFGATLGLAAVSALMCVEPMSLTREDVVVIVGAAGGIGGFAVQMARHAGARVIAVTRGVNAEYVRGLGADEVVDYTAQDVVESVRNASPDGIAGIVHTAGTAETLAGLAAQVRRGGHLSSMIGGAKVDELASHGVTGINVVTGVTTARLDKLAAMTDSGTLKRVQIKTFKLDEASAAFAAIGAGHLRGKLVIVP